MAGLTRTTTTASADGTTKEGTETTSMTGPGFGTGAAIVALLAAAFLATNRSWGREKTRRIAFWRGNNRENELRTVRTISHPFDQSLVRLSCVSTRLSTAVLL